MAVSDLRSPALERLRRLRSSTLPSAAEGQAIWVGPILTFVLVVVLELLRGRGIRFPDPAPILLIAVVASGLVGGLRPGLMASGVAVIGCLLAFSGPPYSAQPDNLLRVLVLVFAIPAIAALVGWGRDQLMADRDELDERRGFARRLGVYSAAVAREPLESVFAGVVDRVPALVPSDMVALTLADPRDSRHVVRAVHGTDPALVGVEIAPGVGVAGQAIVSREVVVAERLQPAAGTGSESAPGSTVAAVPIIVDGRVMATLTLGRTHDLRPFSALEREHLALLGSATALVLQNAQLRTDLTDSSLRDSLTGLFNRTYLDAALDQLLALRRRMKPEDRRPLAVLLFDVNGFRRLNEQHGRADGDRVLQAVGSVLRRRFRNSDTMARIGGDGFLVVMDGADRSVAMKAAADVRGSLEALRLSSSRSEPMRVSVSVGLATFEEADPGAQAVIRTVEAALDTARVAGRDEVVSL